MKVEFTIVGPVSGRVQVLEEVKVQSDLTEITPTVAIVASHTDIVTIDADTHHEEIDVVKGKDAIPERTSERPAITKMIVSTTRPPRTKPSSLEECVPGSRRTTIRSTRNC